MDGAFLTVPLKLAGALAMFLFGIQYASEGLQRAAGERLQKAIDFMTRNTLVATLTGFVVTVLLQSSSAATVMVVSFSSAGLLGLPQAIGVIMGANIGTTVTGWIIAAVGISKFSIALLAMPLFGAGYFMTLARKRRWLRNYGEGLMGFAMVFLGLEFLAAAIPTPSGEALLFLEALSHRGWAAVGAAAVVGSLFTMLINASSATIAIAIGFASKGIINFEMAAALVVGANIGTTINSFLASIGGNVHAKRAAWSHILFNVFGGIWVVAALKPFSALVDLVVPGPITTTSIGAHIAMLHTMFNLANTVALFPLVRPYARLVSWLFRERPGAAESLPTRYRAPPPVDSAELNLVSARKEISDLAGLARDMFADYAASFADPKADSQALLSRSARREDYADQMREGISKFLFECARRDLSENSQESLGRLFRMVDDLEGITDDCHSLALIHDRLRAKDVTLPRSEREELEPVAGTVERFLDFVALNAGAAIDEAQLAEAAEFEDSIDDMRSALRKKARKRLKRGAEVRAELAVIDLARHLEKIGDRAFSVAQELRALR
ncbi:MAG: Na/Pi cotransporter family protein [Spirochaetales bacterium]|nr:Na/Pi cotransporter family protein [Spirochaetales bacterium]